MFDRRQLAALTTTLRVQVPRQNAEAARTLLAETAEAERARVLREQRNRAGVTPSTAHAVDGRRGADFRSVRPDGMILLEFGYVREIAARAAEELIKAGPRNSGAWAAGIVVLVNDAETEPGAEIPHDAANVALVSTVPYARKLEIGHTKDGFPFILDDEDYRLVERTAQRLRSIYAGLADVRFNYIDLEGAWKLKTINPRTGRTGGVVRYPAIFIRGWQVTQ